MSSSQLLNEVNLPRFAPVVNGIFSYFLAFGRKNTLKNRVAKEKLLKMFYVNEKVTKWLKTLQIVVKMHNDPYVLDEFLHIPIDIIRLKVYRKYHFWENA